MKETGKYTVTRITTIKCDICGEEVENDCYDYKSGILECIDGKDYPEYKTGERYTLDFCVNCMLNKVIPIVEKAFNIKARQCDLDDVNPDNI